MDGIDWKKHYYYQNEYCKNIDCIEFDSSLNVDNNENSILSKRLEAKNEKVKIISCVKKSNDPFIESNPSKI